MKISTADWNTVSKLLDEALDLAPVARATWLEHLAGSQPALAPSLRQLLAAHATSETADVMARLPKLSGAPAASKPPGLNTGDGVGPYRLKIKLGAGGMADVWLAERADGAFARDVALKLPRINRLRQDLAVRFARERDILARLEHPHIARLYDAGVSDDGLPYLAMEFVDGQSITTYCDAKRLDIAARLGLFAQVLGAVQFAHANLIIHRDLKPSNILVGNDGQVRLLDFGIAKLLTDGESALETQLTQSVGRALTPDYASPEQIRGEPLTIASDVYSLGVVLYELLAGNRPYVLKLQSAAQLELAILETESARPSTHTAASAAALRGTTARQLTRSLAGDLDTIVLKALAKQPAQRYGTIAAFADDLQRYRDGNPVAATPPSRWYRARKFVIRNRLGVGAAAAVGVSLIAAAAVSWWQAQIALEQAKVAQREARRAGAVQNFLLDIFRTNSDQQKDPVKARNTTARELLDIGAARVAKNLQDVPEAQDEVLHTLAQMYWAVGLDDAAAAMVRQQVETRRRTFGHHDPRVAEALLDLAQNIAATNDKQQVPALLAEAKAIIDARPDTPEYVRSALLLELARASMYTAATDMRTYAREAAALMQLPNARRGELATALRLEARANHSLGHWNAAAEAYEQANVLAKHPDSAAFNLALTTTLELADVRARQAQVAMTEKLYRDILGESIARNGETHIDTLHVQIRLAHFLHETSRRTEARALLQPFVKKLQRGEGGDTPNLQGIVARNVAGTLFYEGQFAAAAGGIATDLDLRRRLYPNSVSLATAMMGKVLLSTETGRYEEASTLLDAAQKMNAAALGRDAHPVMANRFLLARAHLQTITGRPDLALQTLKSVAAADSQANAVSLDRVRANIMRAAAHLKLGQPDEAIISASAAREELSNPTVRNFYQSLEADTELLTGKALLKTGAAALARAALERALALRIANDHADSPWIAEVEIALAACLATVRDNTSARQLLTRAAARHAAQKELGEHFTRPLRASAAR